MGRGSTESWTDKLKRENQESIRKQIAETPDVVKKNIAERERKIDFYRKKKTPGVGN